MITREPDCYRDDGHEYRYDLNIEQAQSMTKTLLAEQPPSTDSRFVCYRLAGDHPQANIGRTIERMVFEETFVGNDATAMLQEYGPYEANSTFFISIDTETAVPSGALRVITEGVAGLKTLSDLEQIGPQLSQQAVRHYHGIEDGEVVWDIGTVAVLPAYRSAQGAVSVQLYRGLYVSAMQEGVRHFVSVIDDMAHKKLTGYLGVPFEPLAGTSSFEYIGSENSQAVYGFVPDFYPKMNRKRWTPRGMLARKALQRLVRGSEDHTLQF